MNGKTYRNENIKKTTKICNIFFKTKENWKSDKSLNKPDTSDIKIGFKNNI